jgi:hypothetical protein
MGPNVQVKLLVASGPSNERGNAITSPIESPPLPRLDDGGAGLCGEQGEAKVVRQGEEMKLTKKQDRKLNRMISDEISKSLRAHFRGLYLQLHGSMKGFKK